MKYQNQSFRLQVGAKASKRDKAIKIKLKELKMFYKKSYNELLKIGIESLCLPTA
jgi:hypothetical protein